MSRYEFEIFEINRMDDENEEHLLDTETDSAFAAVKKCLSPDQKGNYFKVTSKGSGQVVDYEFSPYATWKSWEIFEGMLRTHILSYKVQLNVDISEDRAAEDLIISVIEAERHSR